MDPAASARGQWAETLTPIPLVNGLGSPVWLMLPQGDGLPGVLTRTVEHLQSTLAAMGPQGSP